MLTIKYLEFHGQNGIQNFTQGNIHDKWQGLSFVWLNDALESTSHIGNKTQKIIL